MKVIKRDGRIQHFEISKIRLTIDRASEEIEEAFTESDINNISKSIEKEINAADKTDISVQEIQEIVLGQLKEYGFINVAKHYEDYIKK